jgi:hypothetical protein
LEILFGRTQHAEAALERHIVGGRAIKTRYEIDNNADNSASEIELP